MEVQSSAEDKNIVAQSKVETEDPTVEAVRNTMKDGDAVIIYEDVHSLKLLKIVKGSEIHNRFGTFRYDDFIGKEFGSKIAAKKNTGFIFALKPNPSLVTASIPHRTQILYDMDISFILLNLDIKPGDKVIESGTGTGSLSFSFASGIGNIGHLYTFEFNEERAQAAKAQFNLLGKSNITVVWRDSCRFGFLPGKGDSNNIENETFDLISANAAFLDLPKPWEAIPHAHEVLVSGGHLCCFSPCIEQVQKNCEQLFHLGYKDIRTFEVLLRNLEKKIKHWKSLDEYESSLLTKRKKVNISKELEGEGGEPKTKVEKKAPEMIKKVYISQGQSQERGHTGYLTFARK